MTTEGDHSSRSLEPEISFMNADARWTFSGEQIPLPIQNAENKEGCPAQIEKSANFLLAHLCQPANDPILSPTFPDPQGPISKFFSISAPEISVSSYLKRLQLYAKCSPSTIIYAIIYLKRVEQADCRLAITAYTMHRLLTASVLVAVKFLEEAWYSNAHYGRVGGMASVHEMNRLELEFLRLLNYRAYVPENEFKEMVEFGLKGANSGNF